MQPHSSAMDASCPSRKAELLAKYVFEKVGPKRAPLFVPLLRKWAAAGREVQGTRFSLQEVEDAIRLSGVSVRAESAAPAENHVPTPTRAAVHPRMSDTSAGVGDSAMSSERIAATADASALASVRKEPSAGELLQHAASSGSLGQDAQQASNAQEKLSISLRGTRMDIRANPPRLCDLLKRAEAAQGESVGEPERKRRRICSDGGEVEEQQPPIEIGLFGVPRLLPEAAPPRQTLRISAGRAAAAAGIHPFTDVGELFLELVYQDLPDLLLRDAELAGIEVISPMVERAKLMAKSGELFALESALKSAAAAEWVQGAQEAQRAIGRSTAAAKDAGRLTAEEAEELQKMLEFEINVEFGARHEDAATAAYAQQICAPVFGEQRRVSLALPPAGPAEALAHTLPPLRSTPLPREEPERKDGHSGQNMQSAQGEQAVATTSSSEAYLRLTGFVDGLVDLPREQADCALGHHALETLVVEIKHRIGKIKDPPNIYDVVQLCCYCRVFGLRRGHLVQCLREERPAGESSNCAVGQLHVASLDFSVGSEHRKGWDEMVLPSLYKCAGAVYAARASQDVRLRLLTAPTPLERKELVGSLCPHLGR